MIERDFELRPDGATLIRLILLTLTLTLHVVEVVLAEVALAVVLLLLLLSIVLLLAGALISADKPLLLIASANETVLIGILVQQ